jgi:hypothetical protein
MEGASHRPVAAAKDRKLCAAASRSPRSQLDQAESAERIARGPLEDQQISAGSAQVGSQAAVRCIDSGALDALPCRDAGF